MLIGSQRWSTRNWLRFTINAPGLAKVIIDVVMRYHGLSDSIITNWGFLFISKFWSFLCYFFGIKRWLSTTFYLQIYGNTKRQNTTIKAYLQVFINFVQNDWAKLPLMIEFAYNNAKNASTSYTLFELNCGYHLCVFFKKDTNPYSQSKTANKLLIELRELIFVCRKNLHHIQKFQK